MSSVLSSDRILYLLFMSKVTIQMSKTCEEFQLVLSFVLFLTLKLFFFQFMKNTSQQKSGGTAAPPPLPSPPPGLYGSDNDTYISEKNFQNVHDLHDKLGCKKCFGYCNNKVNAINSFNIDNHKIQNSKLIKRQ